MVLTVPILLIVSSTIVLGKAPPGVVSSLFSFLQERKISVRPMANNNVFYIGYILLWRQRYETFFN